MSMNMNYASNRIYFKPKRILSYIGGGIALLGFPAFFISGGMLTLALPFVAVGALCIVINHEINVKDSDVEAQIQTELTRLATELEDHFYDVKHPFPKMMMTTVGNYVTEGEGLKIRKSSLGKYITSEYHAAVFGLKGDRLYISEERFSTVENRVQATITEHKLLDLYSFDYAPVEGAACPHSRLALRGMDGTELLNIPAPSDFTMQKYAEDMNDILKKHRADAGIPEPDAGERIEHEN